MRDDVDRDVRGIIAGSETMGRAALVIVRERHWGVCSGRTAAVHLRHP